MELREFVDRRLFAAVFARDFDHLLVGYDAEIALGAFVEVVKRVEKSRHRESGGFARICHEQRVGWILCLFSFFGGDGSGVEEEDGGNFVEVILTARPG